MYIFLTGGKTMGHITPLLCLYNELKNDYEIIYFGLENSMEEGECKRIGIRFYPLDLLPFYRKRVLLNFKSFNKLIKEIRMIKKEFKNTQIKAIISSGGYVSFPLVYAFKNNKKIKKILLEPNSVLGLTNKLLVKNVDYVCTQFPISNNKKFIQTGNPITILPNTFDHPSFYLNKEMILFIGGSNGALEIVKLANEFNNNYPDIEIFVITGERYYETFVFNSNAHVYKKIINLNSIFKFFKLIVSRAGASTISEIIITNSASILFPSNNVTANHQYKNALYLKEKSACILLEKYQKNSYLDVYNSFINQELILDIKKNLEALKKDNSVKNVISLL